ncbi:hypothetical protein IAR50_005315 [Cryptococcus sp. DSM 104548]
MSAVEFESEHKGQVAAAAVEEKAIVPDGLGGSGGVDSANRLDSSAGGSSAGGSQVLILRHLLKRIRFGPVAKKRFGAIVDRIGATNESTEYGE